MAERGAFGLPPNAKVAEAIYVKLLGKDGGEERPLDFKKDDQTIARSRGEAFQRIGPAPQSVPRSGDAYPPRPFPKFAARYNAYDHLARVKEWSLGRDDGDGA